MPGKKKSATKARRKPVAQVPPSLKGIVDGYGSVATERAIILHTLERLDTAVDLHKPRDIKNHLDQSRIGLFRPIDRRKSVTADMEIIEYFHDELQASPPSFLEAGPRDYLETRNGLDGARGCREGTSCDRDDSQTAVKPQLVAESSLEREARHALAVTASKKNGQKAAV